MNSRRCANFVSTAHTAHSEHTHGTKKNTPCSQEALAFILVHGFLRQRGFVCSGGGTSREIGQQTRCFKQPTWRVDYSHRQLTLFASSEPLHRFLSDKRREAEEIHHDGSHVAIYCLHSLGGLVGWSGGARGGGSYKEKRGGKARGIREVCLRSEEGAWRVSRVYGI